MEFDEFKIICNRMCSENHNDLKLFALFSTCILTMCLMNNRPKENFLLFISKAYDTAEEIANSED